MLKGTDLRKATKTRTVSCGRRLSTQPNCSWGRKSLGAVTKNIIKEEPRHQKWYGLFGRERKKHTEAPEELEEIVRCMIMCYDHITLLLRKPWKAKEKVFFSKAKFSKCHLVYHPLWPQGLKKSFVFNVGSLKGKKKKFFKVALGVIPTLATRSEKILCS